MFDTILVSFSRRLELNLTKRFIKNIMFDLVHYAKYNKTRNCVNYLTTKGTFFFTNKEIFFLLKQKSRKCMGNKFPIKSFRSQNNYSTKDSSCRSHYRCLIKVPSL